MSTKTENADVKNISAMSSERKSEVLGLILSEVFNYAQIETILVYVYGKYSAGEGSKLISDGYEEEHFRPILELLTDEEIGEFLREYLPGRLANELHAKKVILEW